MIALKSLPFNAALLLIWLIVIGLCLYFILGFYYEIFVPIIILAFFSLWASKRSIWLTVFIIIISIVGPLVFYLSVMYRFDSIKPQSMKDFPPNMIWAHRGYSQGFAENSLDSFDVAKKMGYYGIELDIHFLDGKGLVVAHDIEKDSSRNNTYLLLITVFDRYKNQFYYWLDFKNLFTYNAHQSGKILSRYMKKYGLDGHIFIESTSAKALRIIKTIEPRIKTIYWLPGNIQMKHMLFRAKYQVLQACTDTVSAPEQYANDMFLDKFSHLNMNIFTVNDPEKIKYFFNKGVRVVLSDIDMRNIFPQAYRFTKNSSNVNNRMKHQ